VTPVQTLPAAKGETRDHGLDGLRGLASLNVALCHFVTAFQFALLSGVASASHFPGDTSLARTPIILLFNPELGVAIFFVLSGFVLASSVNESGLPLRALIGRRWVRLALPIVAASIFAFVIPSVNGNSAQAAASVTKSFWLGDEYAPDSRSLGEFFTLIFESAFNILVCIGNGAKAARLFNSNLWTMPIEFLGSVGLFVTYRLLLDEALPKRTSRLVIMVLLIACFWNTPFYGFPAGAALFELRNWLRETAVRRPWLAGDRLALVLGAFVLIWGLIFGGTPFELDLAHGGFYTSVTLAINAYVEPVSAITTMHHLGALFIVAAALLFNPLRYLLERPAIQFLGQISFMVYLVQIPLLYSLASGIVIFFAPRMGYNGATLLSLCAFLPAVIGVAMVLTRYVDMPAIRASRRAGIALAATVH
jgi:peptidoglycan/LPS O-acetylase OafA/YrhL